MPGEKASTDRKTERKYLHGAPREYRRKPKRWKIDPFRVYLRERWEQGVENASRLFRELQKGGYTGCVTQVRNILHPWRTEGRERAFVRFETTPGEQAQMDWGHFGNWAGRYGPHGPLTPVRSLFSECFRPFVAS